MTVLREAVKRQIVNMLDKTIFTSADFAVEFGSQHDELMFRVTFEHDNQYSYEVERYEGIYTVRETPGAFEVQDYRTIQYFDIAVENLTNWASEVRKELVAKKPEFREIDQLKASIEEALSASVESEDDEFTIKEINRLHEMFASLEQRISELESNDLITAEQKDNIISTIENVSSDMELYPKKTWIKTSINKLVKTVSSVSTSKEGRALISDGARKLLGLE